jgi:hypothetical protein
LDYLDEVMATPSQDFGSALFVEAYRIKGELLVVVSPNNPSEVERCFLTALKIAQEQGALMLELRVANSLTRFWWNTAQREQGRQLVRDAYARFTEGFSTVDLIEARELLGQP